MDKKQLPHFILIVSKSVSMYRARLNILAKLILTYYALMFGLVALAIFFAMTILTPAFEQKTFFAVTAIILSVFFLAALALLSSWLQAAIILAIKDEANKTRLRIILDQAKNFAAPIFFTTIVSGLAIMAGCLLFFVFGVIFSTWFSFVKYSVVINKKKGMAALLDSREYCRGFFWQVLILNLLGFLSLLFVNTALESFRSLPGAGGIIYLIISAILWPMGTIYTYLIFDILKKIKGDLPAQTQRDKTRLSVLVAAITAAAILIAGLFSYKYSNQITERFKDDLTKNLQNIKLTK